MKKVYLFVLLSLFVANVSIADTIDVQIKGIDDGNKTTKQQDYKEAVLFAKREAIERAGVNIKSMTTVKDMMLKSDYIETQAEAVLLPGYNILDMGYSADGTYQVVLIGKIKLKETTSDSFYIEDLYLPFSTDRTLGFRDVCSANYTWEMSDDEIEKSMQECRDAIKNWAHGNTFNTNIEKRKIDGSLSIDKIIKFKIADSIYPLIKTVDISFYNKNLKQIEFSLVVNDEAYIGSELERWGTTKDYFFEFHYKELVKKHSVQNGQSTYQDEEEVTWVTDNYVVTVNRTVMFVIGSNPGTYKLKPVVKVTYCPKP